jgi:hypothetical protein
MKVVGLMLAATTASITLAASTTSEVDQAAAHLVESSAQPHQPESQQLECRWGAGSSVPQPSGGGAVNLTCTPPSVIGSGKITVDFDASATLDGDAVYLDAQMFSYHPKPPARPGNGRVKVALLALGADGATNFSTSLEYVAKAGSLGVDLCVLPENFAQKHVGTVGDMDPPPQPVTGPIITAVAALARKYSMNVVAPIREDRADGVFLNTAVVIARNGSVVGRYSKLFPVLGPPDVTGAGSREEQVHPSEDGVVAIDLDFGRISLAICFDINFGEVFQQAANLGSDILVWPSAMHTPDPFSYGYARLHQ